MCVYMYSKAIQDRYLPITVLRLFLQSTLNQIHHLTKMPTSQSALSSATIAPEVFSLRPDYRALLITLDNLTPGPSDSTSEALLLSAETHARALLSKTAVNDLPHISAWRTAYKAFGAKPNKTRNSLEALTRRVDAGGLPRVNRLTDIYNAICVKHQIPIGGEDLDTYVGAPRLIRADGTETFVTKAGSEKADVGEVVWCDDEGVTCRRWNWRQGPRTAIEESTTRVLFVLDVLDPVTDSEVQAAGKELVEVLRLTSPDIVVGTRMVGRF
jgi:DNA/RNA-binding domain of Phe-tRNA-synthetase-like protein